MTIYPLDTVFDFSSEDGHPPSKIVGVDHYQCEAEDGSHQTWASYTLVPTNPEDQKGDYERWYLIDMPPPFEMTVCHLIEPFEFRDDFEKALNISGKVSVSSDGNAELGTGTGQLDCYVDKSAQPPTIYAKEVFDGGEPLYFRVVPLKIAPNVK
ncbi:MAG: hypothetical protein AAGB32_05495 [Pseudomonadota bacterium]